MAQLAGNDAVTLVAAHSKKCATHKGNLATNNTPPGYFLMQATDAVTAAEDTWLVESAPDFSAVHYEYSKPGALTAPLRFVRIAGRW